MPKGWRRDLQGQISREPLENPMNKLTVARGEEREEKKGKGKQRNTNRGLMGTDNGGILTVGVGA